MWRKTLKIILLASVSCVCSGSYDEYMTCDKLYQTRTARVLDSVPCDMQKQTYCEHKGSAYPEHAIWRFKEENKALMRRLYGDVDSTEVYRAMRSNDIFRDETVTKRKDRASSIAVNAVPFDGNMFQGLHYNIRVGSGLTMVKNAKDETLRIKDADGARTRTRTRTRARTEETTQQTTSRTVVTVQTSTSSTSRMGTVSTVQHAPTTDMPTTLQQQTTAQQTIQPSTTEMETTTTTSTSTTATTTPEQQTIFSISEQSSVSTLPQFISSEGTPTDTPEEITTLPPNFSTQEAGLLESKTKDYGDYTKEEDENITLEDYFQRADSTRPSTEPPTLGTMLPEISEDEAVHALIEDLEEIIEEEKQGEIHFLYTGESINACPVYEEVKAPYWANNTRSQVLALLNLYPFEQYIHMERCKEEGEQMLCRPGCRCEQQYRLHRLLAFDPNNECRGIFSDWFSFPSSCLCKCYNVPEQILATINRVPRKLPQETSDALPLPAAASTSEKQQQEYTGYYGGPGPTHNHNTQPGPSYNHNTQPGHSYNHNTQPGPSYNHNTLRLDNHRQDGRGFAPESRSLDHAPVQLDPVPYQVADHVQFNPEASIPAIFPYEGKAAIMHELNRLAAGQEESSFRIAASQDEPSFRIAASQDEPSFRIAASQDEPSIRLATGLNEEPMRMQLAEDQSELTRLAARGEEELKKKIEEARLKLSLEEIAEEHIDNTVESDQLHFKKSSKEARKLDDHFFYNNPIVEFKLPDGTTGSVGSVPRK